jgi:ectoine hydroxylase-related dioxygenase (phytanoyl-CoA dioxygenase family)
MTEFATQYTIKPNDFELALDFFYTEGFFIMPAIIPDNLIKALFQKTSLIIEKIKESDPNRLGNRGPRRYSLGSASLTGHWIHEKEWIALANIEAIQKLLAYLFHSTDYILKGGGGDVCLSQTKAYQPLHRDISEAWHMRNSETKRKFVYGSFYDPRGKIKLTDLPCPYLIINFVIQDLTHENGPMRVIPGTQHLNDAPPHIDSEPNHLRQNTLAGVKRGSIIVRDARTWHSGTPNLTNTLRMLPNIEIYAPWFIEPLNRSLPLSAFKKLNPQAQHAARFIVSSDHRLKTGVYKDLAWGKHFVSDSPFSF